jgi:hypothetical protein
MDERDEYISRYPEAWAYYDPDTVTVYILKEHDVIIVRLHEYGHWLNACLYFILEIIWEFIWWGTGFRSLIKRKGGKIRK